MSDEPTTEELIDKLSRYPAPQGSVLVMNCAAARLRELQAEVDRLTAENDALKTAMLSDARWEVALDATAYRIKELEIENAELVATLAAAHELGISLSAKNADLQQEITDLWEQKDD